MDQLAYRTGVYRSLSEALKQPTAEFIAELPELIVFLKEAFEQLAYDISPAGYQSWAEQAGGLEDLTRRYHECFFYPGEGRIVPVESVYRQWTFDNTAEVPFAKEKGYLMSDAALHMKAIYQEFGLSIPREYDAMPDHLCLELEFAAFLLEQSDPEWYRVFLAEHLDWVDELAEDAAKKDADDFYRDVLTVVKEYVSWERRQA